MYMYFELGQLSDEVFSVLFFLSRKPCVLHVHIQYVRVETPPSLSPSLSGHVRRTPAVVARS